VKKNLVFLLLASASVAFFGFAQIFGEGKMKWVYQGISYLIFLYGVWKRFGDEEKVQRLDSWIRKVPILGILIDKLPGSKSFIVGGNNETFKNHVLRYTNKQLTVKEVALKNPYIFKQEFPIQPVFFDPASPEEYSAAENWKDNYQDQFDFITGGMGSGKSFELIKRVKFAYERLNPDRKTTVLLNDKKIPLYVELNSLKEPLTEEWIAKYVDKSSKVLGIKQLDAKDLKELINSHEVVYFFDGLDEVHKDVREKCIEMLFKLSKATGVHVACQKKIYEESQIFLIKTIGVQPPEFFLPPLPKELVDKVIVNIAQTEPVFYTILGNIGESFYQYLSRPLLLNLFIETKGQLPKEKIKELSTANEESILRILWEDREEYLFKEKLPDGVDRVAIRTYNVWLAKLMQGDAFFVESIQPSWLMRVDEHGNICPYKTVRRLYYVVTRVITAIIIGVALSCIISAPFSLLFNSILGGLVISAMAGMYNTRPKSIRFYEKVSHLQFSICMIIFLMFVCGLYQGFSVPRASEDMTTRTFSLTEMWPGILLGFVLSAIMSYRIILEKQRQQYILPLEIFHVDWKHAFQYGLSWGSVGGIVTGSIAVIMKNYHHGNIFLNQWLGPFLDDIAGRAGFGSLEGLRLNVAIFLYAFTVTFLIASIVIITVAGRYNDPKNENRKERLNYGIFQSIKQSFLHALWAGFLAFVVYYFLESQFNFGTRGHAVRIIIGVSMLSFLWFGGMEVINHGLLRFTLFSRGIAPLLYASWERHNKNLSFFVPTGFKMSFLHAEIAQYYSSVPLKDNPKIKVRKRSAELPFYWFIVSLFVILLGAPFFFRYGVKAYWRNQYVGVRVDSTFVKQQNDSVYVFMKSGKLRLSAKGIVDVGTFVGLVRPEGTRYGFMGMPLKNAYNFPYLDTFRHAALIYRIDTTGKGWSGYSYIRPDLFTVKKGDRIQVVVNDREYQNNLFHYRLKLEFCDNCK